MAPQGPCHGPPSGRRQKGQTGRWHPRPVGSEWSEGRVGQWLLRRVLKRGNAPQVTTLLSWRLLLAQPCHGRAHEIQLLHRGRVWNTAWGADTESEAGAWPYPDDLPPGHSPAGDSRQLLKACGDWEQQGPVALMVARDHRPWVDVSEGQVPAWGLRAHAGAPGRLPGEAEARLEPAVGRAAAARGPGWG